MTDNWIPMRHHNRERGNQRGGGRGGRGGRPASPDRGLQPPCSLVANMITVQQGLPSSKDNILNTFLKVLTFAFHGITVVQAHV